MRFFFGNVNNVKTFISFFQRFYFNLKKLNTQNGYIEKHRTNKQKSCSNIINFLKGN